MKNNLEDMAVAFSIVLVALVLCIGLGSSIMIFLTQ